MFKKFLLMTFLVIFCNQFCKAFDSIDDLPSYFSERVKKMIPEKNINFKKKFYLDNTRENYVWVSLNNLVDAYHSDNPLDFDIRVNYITKYNYTIPSLYLKKTYQILKTHYKECINSLKKDWQLINQKNDLYYIVKKNCLFDTCELVKNLVYLFDLGNAIFQERSIMPGENNYCLILGVKKEVFNDFEKKFKFELTAKTIDTSEIITLINPNENTKESMEKSKLQKQFKFFNINDIEIDIKINDFIQSKTSYFTIKSYKENLIKDIMKDKKINLKHKKKLAQIWQKIDDLFKHEDKEFFNDKHTFIFDKTIDTLSPQEMLVASNCIIKNSISASLEEGFLCHPIYGGTLVLINCSVIGSINDFVDVFLINTSVKGSINHNRCVTIINTTQNDVKIEKISKSATIELFNSNIKDIENSEDVEVYDSWINSIESYGNILIEKSCILGPIKITGSGNITIKSSTIDGSIYAENKSHISIDNFCEGSFVREFKEQENVVENLVDLEKK